MTEKIEEAIKKAKDIVEKMELEEPYKSLTYSKLLEKVLTEDTILSKNVPIGIAETEDKYPNLSFMQFVKKVNPKNHHEKTAIIGYYLSKKEGRNFNYEDLETFYKKALWKKHVNPAELIRQLRARTFIEEEENKETRKKEFRVLEDCLNFVEERLDKSQ